jgi:hypothetical protein
MEMLPAVKVGGVYKLFVETVPRLLIGRERGRRRGIFSTLTVLWLLIFQRLNKDHTLSRAVVEATSSRVKRLSRGSKRVQEGNISLSTGGYSAARTRLSLDVVKMVGEQVFDLFKSRGETKYGKHLYSLDGSTFALERTEELAKEFPPATNQHGESYFPVMNVGVCHDLLTGFAAPPVWGAMYGKEAKNETELGRALIEKTPQDSILLADKAYGIFSICYAAISSGRDVVVRLTAPRAQKIYGKKLPKKCDRHVTWTASSYDKRTNPHIPKEASVSGRVICAQVKVEGKKERIDLLLFTNRLDLSVDQLVELYGYRWNIETDLRHLKRTVNMHTLSAKDPEMVKKELLMGVTAYNFVHAVMREAAEKLGISPRKLSFATVLRAIEAFTPALEEAKTQAEKDQVMKHFFRAIESAKLPKRSRKRREPRAKRPRTRTNFPILRGPRQAV